ncbi:hypothetical protein QVD99_005295 [Batrachochytrium dendrobatidis]|nr:hypothetical protein O5D80_004370 [Batrachochytrium dendrobatidis]KAK5668259.1 hypothetical protein QVD99_005295 [Batrachochytrium dendrobatidis]
MAPRRTSRPNIGISRLPVELIDLIVQNVGVSKSLAPILRVSKAWYRSGIRQLYRQIRFTSSKQRDGFFKMLSQEPSLSPNTLLPFKQSLQRRTFSSTSESPSRMQISPMTPRAPQLPRRGSVSKAIHPGSLVHSIHFGLGPRPQPCLSGAVYDARRTLKQHSARSEQTFTTETIDDISTYDSESPIQDTTTSEPTFFNQRVTRSMSVSMSGETWNLSDGLLVTGMVSPIQSPMQFDQNEPIELASSSTKTARPRHGVYGRPLTIETGRRQSASLHSPTEMQSPRSMQTTATSVTTTTTLSSVASITPLTPYSGAWENRRISRFLEPLAAHCPNLRSLSLSGCQVNDYDFVDMLKHLVYLEHLDISYSTLKRSGMEGIARYSRYHLHTLNVSGVFRLGRNTPAVLIEITMHCGELKTLVALECPEFYAEVEEECRQVNPRLIILREQGATIEK